MNGGTFSADGTFSISDISFRTIKVLRAIVQNTWLDSNKSSPEEPIAAIVTLDVANSDVVVVYHTSHDADAWIVTDDNFEEVFAATRR